MLRCPKCGRTYETDTQKFCTHDGGRLTHDEQADASQAPTAYDLNQTIRTDPFDPEATVTRMPDLNKTVAAAPTSEIRPKDTGPAAAPPAQTPYTPTPPPAPPEREMPPTIAFNQPPTQPPQQYYAPPPPPQQQQHAAHTPPAPPMQQAQAHPPQQRQYSPAHYQPQGQPAAPARKKSSRMPLIIGLLVVALLGAAAAWYFLIYKKGEAGAGGNTNVANTNANANVSANANDNSNTTANANTVPTPTSTTPPPNATEFVNSRDNLDGKLAEHYVDFSFYYPNNWTKDPKAGVPGANNFAKVERMLPPNYTQENFAVGWYTSKGTFEADQDTFPKLAQSLSDSFSKNFPEYSKVSEGPTKVNAQDGYEFRFESLSRGTDKGDIKLWGRVIFLPPGVEGERNGATLLMLTTSIAPELESVDDVGVKGELPVILNSFKMGSK